MTEPARPKRRRRLLLFVPLLLVLGTALALGAFEAVLRVLDPLDYAEVDLRQDFIVGIRGETPPGKTGLTSFHLRPGAHVEFLGATFDINADGFRTPPVEKHKPHGVYRIAVVGDSVPFGWGVPEPACFPRRLETLLNERDHPFGKERVEVLNLSGPGRGLGDYLLTVREYALGYEPDLIVIPFIFNDVPLDETVPPEQKPPPPLHSVSWLRWSWAARYLLSALNEVRGSVVKADYFIGIHTNERASEMCCFGFQLIQQAVGSIPVVILDTVDDAPGQPIPKIAECTRTMGIPRVECYLDRREWDARWAIRPPVHTHPNAAAHDEYAHALLRWLETSGHLK
ncbi:MAG: SGNH/GDSL hydrolase family protein [Planctomycetes bacterium]|nr:SGNH/GDSL hydrolase family protein [Planctomycetota bacterium]